MSHVGVAQMAERHLAKVKAAGSNPVTHSILAGVAQMVEHFPCKEGVASSSLAAGSNVLGRVAQLAERTPEKRKVPGSTPGPTTIDTDP